MVRVVPFGAASCMSLRTALRHPFYRTAGSQLAPPLAVALGWHRFGPSRLGDPLATLAGRVLAELAAISPKSPPMPPEPLAWAWAVRVHF